MAAADNVDRIAEKMVRIYSDAELEILDRITRRLNAGFPETEAELRPWETRKLGEIQQLRIELEERLGRLSAESASAMQAAIEESFRFGLAGAARDLGKLAELVEALTPEQLASVDRAVYRFAQEAIARVQSTHFAILRQSIDIYRLTISETVGIAIAQSRDARFAAQRALDRFANRGVTGFRDSAGRNWDLISYTEMASRTATQRASIAGYLDTAAASGVELVMVVPLAERCSICAPWEGEVLSQTPAAGRTTVAEATSAGLFHPNCRHGLTAYIEGFVEKPEITKEDELDADVRYQERLEQRALERNIRRWKRREVAALDDRARLYSMRKRKQWQGEMRQFIQTTGRRRLAYREQIRRAR